MNTKQRIKSHHHHPSLSIPRQGRAAEATARSRSTASKPRGLLRNSWRMLALLLGIVVCAWTQRAPAAESYTVAEVTSAEGGTFYPSTNGLNDAGELVGMYYPPEPDFGYHPGVWRNGSAAKLPLLPNTYAGAAKSINNAGQIAGYCSFQGPEGEVFRPCVWENGTVRELPVLPGSILTIPTGISDSGAVVGYAKTEFYSPESGQMAARTDGVLWQGGTITALAAPVAGAQTEAAAINNSGEVASVWYSAAFATMPARWSPETPNGTTGTMVTLDQSGGLALEINNTGVVCGRDGQSQPAIWTGTTKTQLPLLADFDHGYAIGINDSGTVAGYLVDMYETEYGWGEWYTAVVWDPTRGARDLNSLLSSPPPTVGTILAAKGINASGQILVETSNYGQYLLLTPSHLPPSPKDLWATGAISKVTLGWTGTAGATSYNVKRGIESGGPYATIAQGVATPSYVDEGVVNNTRYYYVVTAVTPMGESAPSNEAAAVPGFPAPWYIGANAGDRVVSVYWLSHGPATGYNVKRATVSGGPYVTIATNFQGGLYEDRAVVNGTRYFYVVTALSNSIESLPSEEVTAMPLAPPLAPTRLSAKAPKGKVQLKWTQSATTGVERNRIYRAITSSGQFAEIAEIDAGTSFVDTDVARGISYSYFVTALNINLTESTGSNVVTVRTR